MRLIGFHTPNYDCLPLVDYYIALRTSFLVDFQQTDGAKCRTSGLVFLARVYSLYLLVEHAYR